MQDILEQCRRNFTEAPRRFTFWENLTYLSSAKPAWCTSQDKLVHYFSGQQALLENGFVVWGHVVQANRMMFQPGKFNHPGDVLYCPDALLPVGPDALAPIAHALYSLKGQHCASPSLQHIGDHFANEMERVYGLPVPEVISPGFPSAISTIFYDRKHLPNRMLSAPFFPLIVNRHAPRLAMVLPAKYWPSTLLQAWQHF